MLFPDIFLQLIFKFVKFGLFVGRDLAALSERAQGLEIGGKGKRS
jgi:hypothetical protein